MKGGQIPTPVPQVMTRFALLLFESDSSNAVFKQIPLTQDIA